MDKAVILRPLYQTIRPSADEICEIMGYRQGTVPPFIPPLLDVLMNEAPVNVSLAGCFRIFELSDPGISGGKIYFNGGTVNCGTKICHQLSGSDSIALFIATAGKSTDEWIRRKGREEDIMSEYLAGAIGSAAAEKMAECIKSEIASRVSASGKGITNSYSPGYCSWNIMEQKKIFDLLPAEETGVSLTGSFLMDPVKSVSGIVGIGHGLRSGAYICDLCNLENCLVKRARNK